MKEILYNSLLNTTNGLTITDVIINFVAAAVIACLIYISYRVSHSGPVYSERFNVSIVMLTLVTTLVMNVKKETRPLEAGRFLRLPRRPSGPAIFGRPKRARTPKNITSYHVRIVASL